MTGTVVEGRGGFYTVRSDGRLYTLRAQKLRRQGRPLTGDRVIFTPAKGKSTVGWKKFCQNLLPKATTRCQCEKDRWWWRRCLNLIGCW